MSNQTIDGVLVSRELLERFVSDVEAHNYGFDGLDELRALLDKDPILVEGITYKTGLPGAAYCSSPINYGALDPVERLAVCRGERPVAVVVPVRLTDNYGESDQVIYAQGWNACLDEVKRLNP